MHRDTERRLLQGVILAACMVPLLAGGAGVTQGPAMLRGIDPGGASLDLDSHFRYLSGLLLGFGLAFLSCLPAIEKRTMLFRGLGLIVVVGGLARLYSALALGFPGPGHIFGLAMELGTVPALVLWQARIARLYARDAASQTR
ncbi:MAG TPA: DUF4345 domain-containing protein [Allosphingosinicella sp.]|jgi:hypothetical protein